MTGLNLSRKKKNLPRFWTYQLLVYVLGPILCLLLITSARRIPWVSLNTPEAMFTLTAGREFSDRVQSLLLQGVAGVAVAGGPPGGPPGEDGGDARLQTITHSLDSWRSWVGLTLGMINVYIKDRDDTLVMNYLLTVFFALGFAFLLKLQTERMRKRYLLAGVGVQPVAWYWSSLITHFLGHCGIVVGVPLMLWLGG